MPLLVHCELCGRRIRPTSPRVRVVEAKDSNGRSAPMRLCSFHVECWPQVHESVKKAMAAV